MNWYSFIAGVGAGAVVVTMLMFWWAVTITKKKSEWDRETVGLMRERNEIAKDQAKSLAITAEFHETSLAATKRAMSARSEAS